MFRCEDWDVALAHMPRQETVAFVRHMSRPAFQDNPKRTLFPALAASKTDPCLKENRHERQKGHRST